MGPGICPFYPKKIKCDWCIFFHICNAQLQKMLRLRGKAVDDEQKDSGEEQRDEDEGLGPRSNVSLLDQHQHLKEKAEGVLFKHYLHWIMIIACLILFTLQHS